MDSLQDLFLKSLTDSLTFDNLLVMLTARKFKKLGIVSEEHQLQELRSQLRKQLDGKVLTGSDTIQFELDDAKLNIKASELSQVISFTLEEYQELKDSIDKNIKDSFLQVASEIGKLLVKEWIEQAPTLLDQQRQEDYQFNEKIREAWGKALDLLDTLLSVSLDYGAEFNHTHRPTASANNDYVFEALTRLHARGCQVGREIIVLLNNGLADGAHARWRTLHEIAVTASFISTQGADVAERYLLHSHIDTYNEVRKYQAHHEALNRRPLSEKQVKVIEARRDKLITRFGSSFKEDYGWAADALGNPNPRFHHIEENAGLEHLRPYVKLASNNIHAISKGITFRLGMSSDSNVLLAGNSIFGLTDPGQNTAYSMSILTSTVLLSQPNLDNLVVIKAIQMLMQKTYDAFDKAEIRLKRKPKKQKPG
jgi:uncharacterized protein DUF5677